MSMVTLMVTAGACVAGYILQLAYVCLVTLPAVAAGSVAGSWAAGCGWSWPLLGLVFLVAVGGCGAGAGSGSGSWSSCGNWSADPAGSRRSLEEMTWDHVLPWKKWHEITSFPARNYTRSRHSQEQITRAQIIPWKKWQDIISFLGRNNEITSFPRKITRDLVIPWKKLQEITSFPGRNDMRSRHSLDEMTWDHVIPWKK